MRIAIPNKGRLQQPTIELLSAAGIKLFSVDERALIVSTNWKDVEVIMVRPEDIPYIIEGGGASLGITGHDYVVESGAEVEEVLKLDFGKAKIVFAVPQTLGIKSVEELAKSGKEVRIATKYYNIALKYVRSRNLRAKIVKISGAAEVMPYLGAADAVIDVMSTGTTLKIHGLEPIDTVLETQAVVVARKDWILSKDANLIKIVITMLKGVIEGRNKKMLFMNVPSESLDKVLETLPAMLAPAVTRLSKGDAWEVITVVDEDSIPEVVSKVLELGARDIVVVDIEKVIK
ncbi:ATP phosphoribosyltransferase [Ignisphaera sp. 4213-co]|uniref:ATP phosphoribosyltransferase n=1 Tax=Ignisphaera cupida TaxID=3050454 RepID=A0ABD4Z608_9CREN|nr:ATP phosphoribosyltransferase [Ignisphaera sp. 4213-co]MDK6028378.1 ATP phosphoribosyltransferase [Ignisphaera sp. 4213-co]